MERLSNREIIDRIASENRLELSNQKKIKAGRAITRIIDLWDPTNFIFELLQNADDVKATIVNYYFEDNRIIFTHNGTDFEEKQVEAICSIGETTKQIITQIGFMGMGFKSVFKITDRPQIVSEKFRFYFSKEGYDSDDDGWVFIPNWLEMMPDNLKFAIKDGFTHIILPFKSDIQQETKDDIRTFLNKIEPVSIAFLNNITDLNIYFNKNLKLSIYRNGSSIMLEKNSEKRITLYKSIVKEELITEELKKNIHVKKKGRDKPDKVPITLAFLFSENGKFITKEQPFYAFLPTEENTRLKFVLQTDFILNSKRSSLDKEIIKWNAWLIECAQPILWKAIEEFKSNPALKYDFYSILPSQSDNSSVKNHFIVPFIKECRNRDFILTSDEQWKKPDEVIWAEPDFQNLVNLGDLLKMTKLTDGRRYYIHPKFKIESSLRRDLGIIELDESKEYSIILELIKDEDGLKAKTADWFKLLYEFLFDRLLNENQAKRWKNITWSNQEELKNQRIVKDTKGLMQKPFDVLFRPANENFDNINEIPEIFFTDILESTNSGKLLNKLGVKSFKSETVIEKILSGYENEKWNDWTESKKTGGNKFIEAWLIKNKMEIPTNSTIKKEKLSSIRFFCENGKWEKVNECYIANDDLRKILPNALFLKDSTEYSIEFLKYIGVESKLRLIKKGNHSSSEKNVTLHWEKYCNWLMNNERVNLSSDKVQVFSLDGFDTCIGSANKELMQIYLRFLIDNWKDYKEYIKCKYYYPERTVSSYFAFQLKESVWLPTKDGLVKPIKTVFVPNKQIKHLGKDLLVYVDVDEKLIEKGTDFFKDIGLSIELTPDILVSLLNDIKIRTEKEIQGIDPIQLKAKYMEKIKELLSGIYEEIYHKTKSEPNLYYEKYSKYLYLLSTNNAFISINNLFWNDDFKLGKIFEKEGSIHFIWIPDNINYRSDLFRFFKIKKLSDKIIERVQDPAEKTLDPNLTIKLRNKSIYFKSLLFSYKKDEKSLSFFEQVEAYTVNEIKKTYSLNSINKTTLNDPVSCDISKGTIYIKKGSNNSDLAFELTSIFKIDKSNAPFIEDILEKPDTKLRVIFQKMNIPIIGAVPSEPNGEEDIIQEKEKKESFDSISEINTSDYEEKEHEVDDESAAGESEADLVIPSKLIEKSRTTIRNEVKDEPPNLFNGEIVDKNHEHKPPVKPESARETKNKTEISKLEVERIAREIVVSFEKKAGRNAKDCSGNKCGYDIISYDGNSERYIEIKGSKNDYPSFSISGNEWHAAEELKDKYYIYRVAYIKRSQNHTTITIIKNPAEQLATTKKEILEIKDWHRAFEEAETVEFEEENENNGA